MEETGPALRSTPAQHVSQSPEITPPPKWPTRPPNPAPLPHDVTISPEGSPGPQRAPSAPPPNPLLHDPDAPPRHRTPAPPNPALRDPDSPSRDGTPLPNPDAPPPGPEALPHDADAPPILNEGEEEQEEEMTLITSQKRKERRRRHKEGEPKDVPGKESWIHGTKLVFFASRKGAWIAAAEKNASGAFYTKMARLYLVKYGYKMQDSEDLAVDMEDPPDFAANVVVNERMDTEEGAARAAYFKTVWLRIGEWYRRKYGGLLKSNKSAFQDLFTGVLDGAPPKPQRAQLLQFYSRKFYDTRVKWRYDVRLGALQRRAEFTGETVPGALSLANKMTQEAWDLETPGVQEEVREALEREYQTALVGWKASLADSPTRTPQEMAATLENAVFYLQPFVDAIQERFGMCTSLLLCGPIGKLGGVVGMQR
ncbi:hypothetical protein DFH09DRAFT_1068447 [Mycena vulgaris]|nr:hypothetical protein DFH09DRAFT_1068447 [Mycena vulgaris]